MAVDINGRVYTVLSDFEQAVADLFGGTLGAGAVIWVAVVDENGNVIWVKMEYDDDDPLPPEGE